MSHDTFMVIGGGLVAMVPMIAWHVFYCIRLEEQFEERYDGACSYWHKENRKLSAENESWRMGYSHLYRKLYGHDEGADTIPETSAATTEHRSDE